MKAWRRLFFCFAFLVVGGVLGFREIGALLSAADVAGKADVIICLSGSEDRIGKAAAMLRAGLAEKVVATTDLAYRQMLAAKVLPEQILRADWSADSTYEEGLLVWKLLSGKSYVSALVVSDPFHLYRARWTLRHFFSDGSMALSFVSSDAPSLQGFWWSNRSSRLFVLSELPKIVYYWVWHGLLGISEDPEWAIELERGYLAFVQGVFVRPLG
jgi:uncharacterized SAM-binding protein YcdF (DUF218 family)